MKFAVLLFLLSSRFSPIVCRLFAVYLTTQSHAQIVQRQLP